MSRPETDPFTAIMETEFPGEEAEQFTYPAHQAAVHPKILGPMEIILLGGTNRLDWQDILQLAATKGLIMYTWRTQIQEELGISDDELDEAIALAEEMVRTRRDSLNGQA